MGRLPEEPRLHGKVLSIAIAQLHQFSSVSSNLTTNPQPCQPVPLRWTRFPAQ
jgi:hypothetical protein